MLDSASSLQCSIVFCALKLDQLTAHNVTWKLLSHSLLCIYYWRIATLRCVHIQYLHILSPPASMCWLWMHARRLKGIKFQWNRKWKEINERQRCIAHASMDIRHFVLPLEFDASIKKYSTLVKPPPPIVNNNNKSDNGACVRCVGAHDAIYLFIWFPPTRGDAEMTKRKRFIKIR